MRETGQGGPRGGTEVEGEAGGARSWGGTRFSSGQSWARGLSRQAGRQVLGARPRAAPRLRPETLMGLIGLEHNYLN